jgi:hypothetical protein
MIASIWSGITAACVGGIIVLFIQLIYKALKKAKDKTRIYNWLLQNTEDTDGKRWRSTRAIASSNNLSQDRVRDLCSEDQKVVLSTGQKEDMWAIKAMIQKN